MASVFLVINVVIVLGLLSLAVVSLLKGGHTNPVNRLFAWFSIFTAIWIIANHISNDVSITQNVALLANYIVFSSSFAVLILFMQFVIKLADAHKLGAAIKYLPIGLWAICVASATPLLVAGIEIQGSVYAVKFGSLLWLYSLGVFYMVIQIIYCVVHGLLHSRGMRKRQLKSIGVALAVALPLILLFSFIIPSLTGSFAFTEFGITPIIVLVISLYYGVVRYGLFDIRLAIVRTGAYVFSLATLSVIYYYLAYVVSLLFFHGNVDSSVSVSPVNILLALLLAFIFQPIKHFFDKVTNKFFYKDNYSTDDFFARLNHTLSVTTDLRGLLERTAHEISETLKSEQAFFFINTSDGHYVSAGTQHHKQLPKDDANQIGENYDPNSGVIIASLLSSNDPIRRLMLSHRIELILPLIQDDETIGYLCLGDHLTSGYTNRDIKALNTISSELIIAIQNALAVQEIKELNSTLHQRVNNATKELRASNAILRELDKVKDEFVSMASHQLRTPLTSVKGYLSMVIEGDAGKITVQQKQLLEEAFNSSERMVHLINDFLNVSRLQTGKFVIDRQPTDLSKIVQQEIEALQPSAVSRNLEYVYNSPKKFPLLNVDEGKMRQVIMNFADNALYYSHENTKININLSVDGDDILFTVKDSGIGVPASEQKQLFTKFFRASNARGQRPDGTGVGIYLAKKVIEAHGGKIVFESIEGKGSTFGFRLPLKEVN